MEIRKLPFSPEGKLMTKRICRQGGFTLPEMLVAIAISSILIAVVGLAYTSQSKSYNSLQDVNNLQQEMRSALEMVAKEMHMAGYDPTGKAKATIESAKAGEFRFTQDITDDDGTGSSDGDTGDGDEDIRFAIKTGGSSFGRETGGDGNLQPIAENIDQLAFDYLLENGKWTQTPASADYKKIQAIKMILLGHSTRETGSGDGSTFNAPFDSPREDNPEKVWTPTSPGKYHWRMVSTVVQLRNMQIKN